jgi:hypothetical protein
LCARRTSVRTRLGSVGELRSGRHAYASGLNTDFSTNASGVGAAASYDGGTPFAPRPSRSPLSDSCAESACSDCSMWTPSTSNGYAQR